METKHTPGPWRVGRHLGSPSEVRLIHKDVGDKGQGIPIIEGVVSIEDARLIAAAPEMLEALKKALIYIGGGASGNTVEAFKAAYDATRAAINKAEGR